MEYHIVFGHKKLENQARRLDSIDAIRYSSVRVNEIIASIYIYGDESRCIWQKGTIVKK